jgi:hypothetical protein
MQTNGHTQPKNELELMTPTVSAEISPQVSRRAKTAITDVQEVVPSQQHKGLAQRKAGKTPPAIVGDIWIYRIVVGALGLTVLLCVVAAFVTIYIPPTDKSGGGALSLVTSLGSVALGALAGLLAPSPTSKG